MPTCSASHLNSLSLSFLLCKGKIIVLNSQGCSEAEGNNAYRVCLAHKRNYCCYFKYDYYSCSWCPTQPGLRIPHLSPSRKIWGPASCGTGYLSPPRQLRAGTTGHESPSPPLFPPPPKPLLLPGVPGNAPGREGVVLARDPALGSPAPVSMATARAESAAPSPGGHAPAAAYVTRRAARSQTRGRFPARR